MDAKTYAHFNRVARNMNHYVLASSYNYYSGLDGGAMGGFQQPVYSNTGFGNQFAKSLHSIGLPYGIVDLGYQFGRYLDFNF